MRMDSIKLLETLNDLQASYTQAKPQEKPKNFDSLKPEVQKKITDKKEREAKEKLAKGKKKLESLKNSLASCKEVETLTKSIVFLLLTINFQKEEDKEAFHKDLHSTFPELDSEQLYQEVYSSQIYQEAKSFPMNFNEDLYRQVLPLCTIAYMDEGNGIAEEHAFKLATMFKSFEEGFSLRKFVQTLKLILKRIKIVVDLSVLKVVMDNISRIKSNLRSHNSIRRSLII